MKLTLFDLDHTLLAGDSDQLWCEFLIDKGLLDRNEFGRRNEELHLRYQAGTVGAEEFASFYLGTLAGRTPEHWEPLRLEFLRTQITPRISKRSREVVRRHLDAGDLVVMTTATSRFLTELTCLYLGIDHLLATEARMVQGQFTGEPTGTLNMREGKVARLHEWLAARGLTLQRFESTAYSDSINDLPLLSVVHRPFAVDPDPLLREHAAGRGWEIISLR